jgi:hypothetical protein
MDTEPRTTEEEEEEGRKPVGRNAFFAGVYHADTFSGAFRGVPATKHGGAASVRPEDTIGDETHCWCGQLLGHSWPGKDKGVKHPRGEAMTAATEEKPYLNPRDLKSWDRKVVRALCEIVNTYGVNYRIDRNQMHLFLYAPGSAPGDTEITKFKASRSRPPEKTLEYLEQWAVKYVRPVEVTKAATVLAKKLNDPTKVRHEKAPQKAATSTPVPEPTEEPKPAQDKPEPAPAPTPKPDGAEPLTFQVGVQPDGYHQHLGTKDGEPTNWWESDSAPHRYICKSCGATHKGNGFAHQRLHSMTYEERARATAEASKNRDGDAAGRKQKVRNAIKFLAEEYDIPLATDKDATKTTRLEKEIKRLQSQVAEVSSERDDLKAKLDLMTDLLRS